MRLTFGTLEVFFIFTPYNINKNNLDPYTLPPLIFRITLWEGTIIVVISQMSKLRPREVE